MYKFREDKYKEVTEKYKSKYIAEKVGISEAYLSQILNNKLDCKKTVAYCIVKIIDNYAEIEDYFKIA